MSDPDEYGDRIDHKRQQRLRGAFRQLDVRERAVIVAALAGDVQDSPADVRESVARALEWVETHAR